MSDETAALCEPPSQASSPLKYRAKRKARSLDREAALTLSRGGMSNPAIARKLGVAPSSVYRFLEAQTNEARVVEEFRKRRADIFANIQLQGIDLQQRIIASMSDADLAALSPYQKGSILHSVNTVVGTLYDKERLETGKTTSNLGVLGKIMHGSFSEMDEPQQIVDQSSVFHEASSAPNLGVPPSLAAGDPGPKSTARKQGVRGAKR